MTALVVEPERRGRRRPAQLERRQGPDPDHRTRPACCSARPANTNEGLTKPEFGALDIRKTNPTKINYVRVVTTDDNQGPAAARYILRERST